MKQITLTFLSLCFFSSYLFAQPSVTPAAGFYWVKTGTQTWDSGAASTIHIADDSSFGINGNPPDEGSPIIQKQIFSDLGDTRNNEDNEGTIGYEGTVLNANFPII